MKNKITALFIGLTSLVALSQKTNKVALQKENFDQAQIRLAESDLNGTVYYLYFTHKDLPNSTLGKIAIKKSDSLIKIIRNNFIKNVQGLWKWKETGTNWGIEQRAEDNNVSKFLKIDGNNISISKIVKSDSILLETGEIKFVNGKYSPPLPTHFVFDDKRIWTFEFSKSSSDLLKMRNTGELINDDRTLVACSNEELKFERVKVKNKN